MLRVRQIWKSLGKLALKDISFEVKRGEYFVLLGASGVGKSVLLETIAGLKYPDAGNIFLDGKDITNEKIQRRKIGMVFQNGALFPHMNVYDNIAYPLRCKKLKTHQIHQRVAEIAEDFAVTGFLKRNPRTLSGGECQRVSLARALAGSPECLLLDEPISSLDVKSRPQVRALLRKINARGRHRIVHITHDYNEAVSLGTHIAVMENGRIAQSGTVNEVFQHPKSEFVASFVGIRNFFKGRLENSTDGQNTRRFEAGGISFSVLSNNNGGTGFIMVRSEDVTISNSASRTSARNNFEGTIVDIVPVGIGIEVIVDIGLEIAALVTAESVEAMGLRCGKKVWVNFKASAIQYVEQ